MATVVAASPDWEKRYSDGVSTLFVRRATNAQAPPASLPAN